jgi:hypothetical protein
MHDRHGIDVLPRGGGDGAGGSRSVEACPELAIDPAWPLLPVHAVAHEQLHARRLSNLLFSNSVLLSSYAVCCGWSQNQPSGDNRRRFFLPSFASLVVILAPRDSQVSVHALSGHNER